MVRQDSRLATKSCSDARSVASLFCKALQKITMNLVRKSVTNHKTRAMTYGVKGAYGLVSSRP